MNAHKFTLVLGDIQDLSDEIESALFEAGCDDALLGKQGPLIYLDFDREASTFLEAIQSAVRDVEKAGIHVERIEPDELVTMTEIAERIDRSLESVRLWVLGKRGPGDFPRPVAAIGQKSQQWRWSQVAEWLSKRDLIDELIVQQAVLIARLNTVLDARRLGLRFDEKELLQLAFATPT